MPALKVGFFALMHDQDLNAPVAVFARDAAGNEGVASVEVKVFPKPFRKSRIDVDDAFLGKVVPPILDNTPTLKVDRSVQPARVVPDHQPRAAQGERARRSPRWPRRARPIACGRGRSSS